MEYIVFLSHSSKDRATAMEVCAALERRNIRCWIAPRDVVPGIPYATQIVRAIRACRVFVVVFSAHSNISPDVAREVELAANKDKPLLLPFRIEDVAMADELLYFLSGPHWLDAATVPLQDALAQLVSTIRKLAGLEEPEEEAADEPKKGSDEGPPPPHSFRVPTTTRYNDPDFSPFYQARVTSGPHAPMVCLLSSVRADVGRSADCSICLSGEPGISRFHCSFCWDDAVGRFVLVALPTRLGVSVNGVQTPWAALVPGDQITIGSTTLVFETFERQLE